MPPTVQRYRTSSSPRISSGSRSRPMTSCATNQMMATRPHNATATSHKAAATVPSHAPPPPVCASAIPTHRAISPFKRPAARHSSRRTGPCSAARPPWRTARVSLASSMVRVDPLPDASHSFAAPLGFPTSIPTRAPRTLKYSVIPTSPAAEHVLKVARGANPCRFRPAQWRITLLWRLPLQRPP